MKLSLIIPLHNEEENFSELRRRVGLILERLGDVEVVLVDDCSTDSTPKLVEDWARQDLRVKVVHRRGRPGFGLALREGLRAATGDVLIPFMGDLSDSPLDVIRLYHKAAEGWDVAVGARWRRGGWAYGMPLLKRLLSIGFSKASRLILRVPSSDVTNAFKAYRRRVIEAVEPTSTGFDVSAEITLKAHIMGFKLTDVPVGWVRRKRGVAKLKVAKMGVGYIVTLLRCIALMRRLRSKAPTYQRCWRTRRAPTPGGLPALRGPDP